MGSDCLFFECPAKIAAKPQHDFRLVFSAIDWILKTGNPWKYLPRLYHSRSTCHHWHHFKEIFVDATFVRNKGSSALSGKTKCGKGCKLPL